MLVRFQAGGFEGRTQDRRLQIVFGVCGAEDWSLLPPPADTLLSVLEPFHSREVNLAQTGWATVRAIGGSGHQLGIVESSWPKF